MRVSQCTELYMPPKSLTHARLIAAAYPDLISDHLESLWFRNLDSRKQVVQYAPRYRLAFSLLNEDSSDGDCPLSWEVKNAISRPSPVQFFTVSFIINEINPGDIQPTLDKLSKLHNFTIESQVQYFAPLAFEPLALADGSFGLTEEQLSVFVNSAEWTLGAYLPRAKCPF